MVARGDKAFTEGFAILDADGGWDLLCSLIQYEPSARLSASGALAHPWFGVATPTAVLSSTVASLGRVVSTVRWGPGLGLLERSARALCASRLAATHLAPPPPAPTRAPGHRERGRRLAGEAHGSQWHRRPRRLH